MLDCNGFGKTKAIAVVYLARMAQGLASIEEFAKSYRQYRPGIPHDLIVIRKGMTKAGERVATSMLFAGLQHQMIDVNDEGFDIHAYLKVARMVEHEYLLFFNTYSQIVSPNWLAVFLKHIATEGVGLVGATASYESLLSSIKLYSKADWLASQGMRFDAALARQIPHLPPSWQRPLRSVRRRALRWLKDTALNRRPYNGQLDEKFGRWWFGVTRDGQPWEKLRDFPAFPNPHIRSNGFAISRRRLLGFGYNLAHTKEATSRFESGRDSLTTHVRALGLKTLVVGADGVGYDVQDWPKSRTFRLGQQSNLLVSDNHTRSFDSFDKWSRATHALLAWGDYVDVPKPTPKTLGIAFPRSAVTESSARRFDKVEPMPRRRSFSIVIPTRDRLELLLQAIETVRLQNYDDWELAVFDNASKEPVAARIDALGDRRIRCIRSEEFLPVTESWNNALGLARGDYVMLIGDDDGLVPNFFRRLNGLIDEFQEPDVVYSSIYQFFHPGVAPWQRLGYVRELRNGFFFCNSDTPFLLGESDARRAVCGSLSIRRNFTFNMQSFVFSKKFLAEIETNNKVFHSPFPDYYLANVAMALGKRIVVEPAPLAIAGVSSASFGFTLFNGMESQGAELLHFSPDTDPTFARLSDKLLPGPAYNTNYIVTMEHVARRLDGKFGTPDFDRHRRMQILAFLSRQPKSRPWTSTAEGRQLWAKLTLREKVWATRMTWQSQNLSPRRFLKKSADYNPTAFDPLAFDKNVGDFESADQLYRALEAERNPIIEATEGPFEDTATIKQNEDIAVVFTRHMEPSNGCERHALSADG